MDKKEKMDYALQLIKVLKLSGLINIAATSVLQKLTGNRPDENDLFQNKPIFRFAACDDLFQLMAKHPEYCRFDRDSDRSPAYGLNPWEQYFALRKSRH